MDPIRTGKVKDVYDNGDSLLFKFSDRISVFDKIIPVTVTDKGKIQVSPASCRFIEGQNSGAGKWHGHRSICTYRGN